MELFKFSVSAGIGEISRNSMSWTQTEQLFFSSAEFSVSGFSLNFL